jgi:hypothetical protein
MSLRKVTFWSTMRSLYFPFEASDIEDTLEVKKRFPRSDGRVSQVVVAPTLVLG